MAWKIIVFLVRLTVAAVFLSAGVLKIWDFHRGQSATPDFTVAIQHFKLLPTPDLAVLLAVYLPWLEVTAAIALFVRRLAFGAATAAAGMTAVFLIALSSAWVRGLDIRCGCFGKDEVSTNYPMLLTRDALLLAAALVLVVVEARRTAQRPEPAAP
jgi:uncharacterized membrane protein YphA (DoxX/SURF4 family)